MLPRLQAEERLNAITDGAVAAGSMDRREQTEVVAALQRDAGVKRARPPKANVATLAAMGIAVSGPSETEERPQSDG
jgi:hypothetical protein